MTPKEQGAAAFSREDKARAANPFERGTSEHRQWDDGFCGAFLREYGTGLNRYDEVYK